MKKHRLQSILSLLLMLAAMLSFSVTAYAAESGVSFEDGKIIAFAPGSIYTDTDLFDNFKGVMPGDTRTEEITIQNNTKDCDYIKVYMRAVLHDETGNPISEKVLQELQTDERRGASSELEYMHDFLSQLSLKVWNGSALIYEQSPDQLDGMTENVYLGTIAKGKTIKLNVELGVPLEMGNEYSSRIGEVDWIFAIEGFDEPTPPPEDETMLTVRKIWVDNGDMRPDSVTVQLLRDGAVYEEIELNQNNHWAYTWDRLDKSYTWTVREADVPAGYEATYITQGNTTTITNTSKEMPPDKPDPPAPTDPVDLTVVKKWDDDGKGRPDSVKVTLYNGEAAVESVWLGDWNNWSYTWRNLDSNGNWQVIENNIPKGYTPSYSYRNGVVTVTNTATLIQTGQLSWPVPVLGGLGLLLIAYGIFIIARKRKNERA